MEDHNYNEAFAGVLSGVNASLRNKLAVLLPALDLLEKRIAPDGEADAALLRYLGEARRAAFSILRMSKNISDRAKYALDYDLPDPVRTDLAALVSDMVRETDRRAEYKRASVTLDCSERPFFAFVDPNMIIRLLYNLLSNAVLYGTGDINVALKREDGHIVMKVQNPGGGIDGDTVNRLQYGVGLKTPEEMGKVGGLGLSVVSEIVRQNDGAILITSDQINGTSVTISLPDLSEGDEGEMGVPDDPCKFPDALVELADFPAYHPDYNLKRSSPCVTSMP